MRSLLIFLALLNFTFANAPKAVEYVDGKQLSGKWYEIARTYNQYEEGCVSPYIEYQFLNPKQLKVYNRCYEADGSLREYSGVVRPESGTSFSHLIKTYYLIFSSEYRIVYLDEAYQTAIMTDEAMEHVWIMHREPTMSEAKREELIRYLAKYMDTSTLIINPQGATQ